MPDDLDHTEIAFESHGVTIVASTNEPRVLDRIRALMPPSARPVSATPEDARFSITTEDGLSYVATRGEEVLTNGDLDVVLDVFDASLRGHIALFARDRVFVHAGVVALAGRAIVIPGRSFSGKTTLVVELVRAGALYYSDEFAVIDPDGNVQPYAKPLSVRRDGHRTQDHPVESLGGTAGAGGLPLGLVLMTKFQPGAVWNPVAMSSGEGVLALIANTVPAQERPEEVVSYLRKALEGATVLEGERGEAAAVAAWVVERYGA